MKKGIFCFWVLLLTSLVGFARTEGNLVPFQARLSQQQDLEVGDVVALEFWGQLEKDTWYQFSELPYPRFQSIRPVFVPGADCKGIVWAEGDLSRTLEPVREEGGLSGALLMDKHQLVYGKQFKITDKKALVTGTLRGEFYEGLGVDSLGNVQRGELLPYELPVSMELQSRDSTAKRWLMASEKVYDVLAVIVTIFIGLIVYIVITQRKLKKLAAMAEELKN